jgi:hypothetical protein
MKNLFSIRFMVILLGAGLLAACGQAVKPDVSPVVSVTVPTAASQAKANPSTVSSNPSKVDACVLLTKDDVSKVLGQPVDEAIGKGLGGVCSYKSKTLSIDLTVTHTGGTKFVQQTRAKLADSAIDVPGVGDEAFYNVNSYTLFVRKGDAAYLFFLSDSSQQLSEQDRQAKEKALAGQLLSHVS